MLTCRHTVKWTVAAISSVTARSTTNAIRTSVTLASVLSVSGVTLAQPCWPVFGNGEYLTPSYPRHVALGDMDGDFILDAVVGTTGSNDLLVLINAGAGRFQNPVVYHDVAKWAVALGDLDNDGRLDVATIGVSADAAVYLNDGTGALLGAVIYDVNTGGRSIAIGDLDGDGWNDLAASLDNDTVAVFINNGGGTFADAVYYPIDGGHDDLAVGDLDGDGHLDIASAGSVLMNNGDGTFGTSVDYMAATSGPRGVAIGDLDGDEDLDIAIANLGSQDVSVLLNDGNGVFTHDGSYACGDTNDVALGDLDGDGDLDMAVPNNISDDFSVFINQGNGTFEAEVRYKAGTYPRSLAMGDIDHDGDTDVAVVNSATTIGQPTVSFLLNDGSGVFLADAYETTGDPAHVAAADLNGDLSLDLVVADRDSFTVKVFTNNGDGTFGEGIPFPAGVPWAVVAADFTGDSVPDVVTTNPMVSTISVLVNVGAGVLLGPVDYPSGGVGGDLCAADFNNDGWLDVAQPNFSQDTVSVLFNLGLGVFGPPIILPVGNGPEGIDAGDLNGDGLPDLAIAVGVVTVYLNEGSGTFTLAGDHSVGSCARSVVIGDYDGDGNDDIAVGAPCANNNEAKVLFNDGTGLNFEMAGFPCGVNPERLTAGDFDGDGSLDLVLALNAKGHVSVLLNNGDGTFAPPLFYGTDRAAKFPTAAQLDGLNGMDLAVSGINDDFVTVLLSQPTPTADCDDDGVPDICESDCNDNGIPDECEAIADCDNDGIPDTCELDCDDNGVPDDCEEDCNGNGMADVCELQNGTSDDENGNGRPDECDGDKVNVNDDFDDLNTVTPVSTQSSWEPWNNDPAADTYVTNVESLSPPNSLEMGGASNMLHNLGVLTSGMYEFSAWQFIPAGFQPDMPGGPLTGTFVNLMSIYEHGGPYHWAVQLQFDATDGMLKVFDGDPVQTIDVPYQTETWVRISCFIDLDADLVEIYYDDVMITSYPWSVGVMGDGGAVELGAINFDAHGSSPVYYDDVQFNLLGPPCPWDLDTDGVVGIVDFLMLLAAWGPNPGHPADFDDDGLVGINDFLVLLASWGSCP